MPDDSTHLHLPYIAANQAQKHVTHNEAVRLLDALVQMAVISRKALATLWPTISAWWAAHDAEPAAPVVVAEAAALEKPKAKRARGRHA